MMLKTSDPQNWNESMLFLYVLFFVYVFVLTLALLSAFLLSTHIILDMQIEIRAGNQNILPPNIV